MLNSFVVLEIVYEIEKLLLLFQQTELEYKTKEEQAQLLQQVLAANDADAEEEKMPSEFVMGKSSQQVIISSFVLLNDFLLMCIEQNISIEDNLVCNYLLPQDMKTFLVLTSITVHFLSVTMNMCAINVIYISDPSYFSKCLTYLCNL